MPHLLSGLLGDELYAGVATDLMGRDFTIFRSLGKRPSIRTEQHDSRWLNGMRERERVNVCMYACMDASTMWVSCVAGQRGLIDHLWFDSITQAYASLHLSVF